MAVNTLGQYSATHKAWDHVGNVTSDFVISEGQNPPGQFRPASWLPVLFWDKYYEIWKTIMAGKVCAFDNDGRVIPAQYGLGAATITYTATDVTAGVIDVRTGVALVTGGIGTFNVAAVANFMGGSDALAVSAPIGLAFFDCFQDFGDASSGDDGDNPVYYAQHNFRMQHRITFVCDAYVEAPLIPGNATATNLGQLTLAAGTNILDGVALANLPVAANTVRTPTTFTNGTGTDVATRFVNQVTARADIAASGDWFIDLETGIISCFGTATIVANVYQIAYYHYNAAPGTFSQFLCAYGDLNAGDFVQCGTQSNFVVDAAPDVTDTMGQILEKIVHPQDLLDRVMSAYNPPLSTSATGLLPGYDGQADQTPGTATGGVPQNVHYAGGADTVVRVNLFAR